MGGSDLRQDILDAIDFFFKKRTTGEYAARAGQHDKAFLILIEKQLKELNYEVYIKGGHRILPTNLLPAKSWDLVAYYNKKPVIAVEFKGMVGSNGKNSANRVEECAGSALNMRLEYGFQDICLGYLFVLGNNEETQKPRKRRNKRVDQCWEGLSYAKRLELAFTRLVDGRYYDAAAIIHVKPEPSYEDPVNQILHLSGFVENLHKSAIEKGLVRESIATQATLL